VGRFEDLRLDARLRVQRAVLRWWSLRGDDTATVVLGDRAADDVGGAAGREGDEDGDGAGGPLLLCERPAGGEGGAGGEEQAAAGRHRPFSFRHAAKSARLRSSVAGYRPRMERPLRTSSVTKSS